VTHLLTARVFLAAADLKGRGPRCLLLRPGWPNKRGGAPSSGEPSPAPDERVE
jgi:hypothetical protein